MSDGKLHDSRGLLLIKRGETGKWVYRYSFRGKRRDMGLGSWPVVTISEARKTRDKWSAVLAFGKDPIATRAAVIETERLADEYARAEAEDKNDPTFAELVELVFEAKKATLRGDGKDGRAHSKSTSSRPSEKSPDRRSPSGMSSMRFGRSGALRPVDILPRR